MDDDFYEHELYEDDPYEYEDYDDYERHVNYEQLEREDRFFERWGYYPDEETEEQAIAREAQEILDRALEDLHIQSLEGATTSVGQIILEAITKK